MKTTTNCSRLTRIIGLCLFTVILFSCNSSPVKIVVDKIDLHTGKFSIDGKQQYSFHDSIISIELKPGKHSITYNNLPPANFEVGEKGGLLNLDNQEYVAFEIEYADPDNGGLNLNNAKVKAIVLIDSFIIIPKGYAVASGDSMLKAILPDLLKAKNGNYFAFWPGRKEKNEYDTNELVAGVKKFGKDKLYIEKFWDYSPGETIPQTLEVSTRSDLKNVIQASAIKSTVLHAKEFLQFALLSPDQYKIKHIREFTTGD